MSLLPWGVIALAYHLAARLAYVLYIGLALRREDRTAYLAGRHGPAGPYRFLRNPMYTVGYLQTYGFALVTRSWPGLAAALIDHVAILLFYQLVEKPHFEKVARGAARP